MPINTQTLYDQKRGQFASGVGGTRFQSDFIQAIGRASDELRARGNLAITKPSTLNQNIDVDDKYTYALSIGIDYHLLHMGGYTGDVIAVKGLWDDAVRTVSMTYFVDAQTAGTLNVKLGDLS